MDTYESKATKNNSTFTFNPNWPTFQEEIQTLDFTNNNNVNKAILSFGNLISSFESFFMEDGDLHSGFF